MSLIFVKELSTLFEGIIIKLASEEMDVRFRKVRSFVETGTNIRFIFNKPNDRVIFFKKI